MDSRLDNEEESVYYVDDDNIADDRDVVPQITKQNILDMIVQMTSGFADEVTDNLAIADSHSNDLVNELRSLQESNQEIVEKMKTELNILSETLKKITIIHENNLELERKFTRGIEILAKKKSRDEEFEMILKTNEVAMQRCLSSLEECEERLVTLEKEMKSLDNFTNLRLTNANNTLLCSIFILAVAIFSRLFL